MKNNLRFILIVTVMYVLVACNGQGEDSIEKATEEEAKVIIEETKEEVEDPIEETQEEVVVIPEGYVKSRLTGLYVTKDIGQERPFAVMFNNVKDANPQSGTQEASIVYEALVEGGITRLMGIFEDLHPDRIGSVRSGRQYFASIADEYDAIFVSYGESSYCTEKISELGLDQISGLKGEGRTVFYRDTSIKAPHNAFASKEGILKGRQMRKYETLYDVTLNNHFTFKDQEMDINSQEDVNKLTINFSRFASPYFNYDKEAKVYKRFQLGGEHIDANSGKQLEFKNIIIQFVDGLSIDETRNFSFKEGSGQGYYITNGKAIPVTWTKNEKTRTMVYYDGEGEILSINPGKTYVGIIPGNKTSDVIFE